MVEQVQIPHSVVDGKAPTPEEIVVGGLAVNLKDYTLYSKGYDGVVIKLTGVVTVQDDNEVNAPVYLSWVKQSGPGSSLYTSSAKLFFNPATGRLSAPSFSGNGAALTGFTADQIEDALGFAPAVAVDQALPGEASDLATVIALANSMRAALTSSGIGA